MRTQYTKRDIWAQIVSGPPFALMMLVALLNAGCGDDDQGSSGCFTKEDCDDGETCLMGKCIDDSVGSDSTVDTDTSTSVMQDTATELSTDTKVDSETEEPSDTTICHNPEVDCPDDGNGCTTAVCKDEKCAIDVRDGEFCHTDSNPCTDEICVSDKCTAYDLDNVACELDDNECTRDVCVKGTCSSTGNLDGTPCSFDDNPCTLDLCKEGVCGSVPRTGTPCAFDDNVCTNDVCINGECKAVPVDNVPCPDDGNACTNNVCRNGVCEVESLTGTPCSIDTEECTADKCVSGVCTALPLSSVSCTLEGGDECKKAVCVSGVCGSPVGNVECTGDDKLCTRDRCSPEGECVVSSLGEGALCDDGLKCNGIDKCGPNDECLRDPDGLECSAPMPCQDVTCEEPSSDGDAPVCEIVKLDGVSCENELFCDGVETCVQGICKMTEAPCQGLNPGVCGQVVCEEPSSCSIVNHDDLVPCGDSDLCDGAEVCLDGVCTDGPPVCGTGNDCITQACEQANGQVVCGPDLFAEDGVPCAQGTACGGSGDSWCMAGVCTEGETPACESDGDGNFCSYTMLCQDIEGVPDCQGPMTLSEPRKDGTLACSVVKTDEGDLITSPTYDYSTVSASNEVSVYAGCGGPSGFTGGERTYGVQVAPNAAFAIQLTTTSSSQAEDLYVVHVTNPCDTESTVCAAYGQGGLTGTADGEGKAFVVIDGLNGNRGKGTISLECP